MKSIVMSSFSWPVIIDTMYMLDSSVLIKSVLNIVNLVGSYITPTCHPNFCYKNKNICTYKNNVSIKIAQ